MTIPPFPSQDLAKLVLGYLAEEQLMTAYDEFLQASPYLDALGNEYDRIFMTSLKNILAEYRAVKIYVETCKPFSLRKKMFQCANLFEMVKFLIQNVDVNKIQVQESNQAKYSYEKQSSFMSSKNISCDVCNSLKLDNCTCKSKNVFTTPSNSHISTSSIENSVEATPLSELPGSHVTCRTKNARLVNKDISELNTVPGDITQSSSRLPINNELLHKACANNNKTNIAQRKMYPDINVQQNMSLLEKPDSLEMRQKEEFNNILNQVWNKNDGSKIEGIDKQRKTSMAGYDEFATGVNSDNNSVLSATTSVSSAQFALRGHQGVNNANAIVPDSSTSESLHVQIPATKENNSEQSTKVTQTKTQYLLKVANVKNNVTIQPNEVVSISTMNTCTLPRIKPKPDESKVKILSDVKVDQPINETLAPNRLNMPAVLRNATSTPLLQMQTIVINGTPVYKNKPFPQKHNYTKDEIMAMPTIILAPAPDPTQIPVSQPKDSASESQCIPTSISARPLGPLIIDVTSSSNSTYAKNPTHITDQSVTAPNTCPVEENKVSLDQNESTVAKTDITSASAPKDNTVSGTNESSTPQVFPPLRKSSSTPRRTSHVRVLDFTTPRRILHETINKCVPHSLDNDKEIVLSKSSNISMPTAVAQVGPTNNLEEGKSESLKENVKKVKKNWDADLRILATVPETDVPRSPKPKPKPKLSRKSKASKDQTIKKGDKTKSAKTNSKKKSPKKRVPKNKSTDVVEVVATEDDKVSVPVKPTINIIAGVDRNPNTSSEVNKSQNKSNNEDNIDTPELERISLQNEIGVKLNISDLLETPYKQALYDIQMETPRFLGPDIPDDPMSDIKIMNIPTPRFLNTATPSSYSSRPTDYSSGGSYYKPEDQDYMRVHDELDCIVTSTKTNDGSASKENEDCKEKENMRPSRPVRECTKNISYSLANMSKLKPAECKADLNSSVDSVSTLDATERMSPITPRTKELKPKLDAVKKGSVKKKKSPVKKEMKSFMKIKPRRPTPTKNNARSKRKTLDPASHSNVTTRKKAGNKESNEKATPVCNSVPTKSRRKSSTPRKLHCSKSFHSESSGHDSPELVPKNKEKVLQPTLDNAHDSDTEQLPLRWSDDGSQEPQPVIISIPNDTEDIKQIKEYIETSKEIKQPIKKESSLHIDLVKRGFDLETAKSIERDLLDTPPHLRYESESQDNMVINAELSIPPEKLVVAEKKTDEPVLDKTLESDCSTTNNLQIVQNEGEEPDEEIELSVYECNEDSTNYFTCSHDSTKDVTNAEVTKLKDKFFMEVCIDDGVTVRIRATPFSLLMDQDPQSEYLHYSYRETEMAVSSISNFEKLYTPLKESIKAQCYEIFDSTLTSLDTPLKVRSPKKVETELSVTEIVLEVEKVEEKESKKRKRGQSGNLSDEGGTESKKVKPESQLLFNSTSIQNFDIDSVLSKLHGP